jgi:hypothetical protein
MPFERFLSMLRFENKGKLDDLGFDIVSETMKMGRQWFESGF